MIFVYASLITEDGTKIKILIDIDAKRVQQK